MHHLDCNLVNVLDALREDPTAQVILMEELLDLKVIIGSRYTSPFRKDRSPGCFFRWENGILKFKDFAADISLTGDVINMLELCSGLTKSESLKYLNHRFNLGLGYDDDVIPKLRTTHKITVVSAPAIIRYEYDSKYAFYDYFYEYGIQLSTLRRFLVLPCKTVWVKSKKGAVEEFRANKSNPVYLYCWRNCNGEISENYKMLRPLTKNKDTKWRTNHSLIDDVGLNGETNIDFITSSRKDRMALFEAGYTSICANSESQIIRDSKYTAKYTFMDIDEEGIESAGKYDLPALFVPKEDDVKDPSDYAKKYGIQALKNLINELLQKSIKAD